MKVGIANALDTFDYKLLLRVLQAYLFNLIFCNWINIILHSARLSISINGKQHVFFSCKMGLGKEIFYLHCYFEFQEVIGKSITKMVRDGQLNLIHDSRDIQSHE